MIFYHRQAWDAESGLIKITYPGVNNFSDFTFDGYGRNVKIVETVAGSVTSTKQFVVSGSNRREERDGSGTLTKQFFEQGQMNSATVYFYDGDQLGSVREMTDNGGVVQAQYSHDPYGRLSKISEAVASDFGYANYYLHSRSSLNLTLTRSYSGIQGRFLSRDSIGEAGGDNLYAYVGNDPVSFIDPSGQAVVEFNPCPFWQQMCRDDHDLMACLCLLLFCRPKKCEPPPPDQPPPEETPEPTIWDGELPRIDKRRPPTFNSPFRNPHSQMGTRPGEHTGHPYRQARTWGQDGNWEKDIHFTDHSRPWDHTDPHQHTPNHKAGMGPQQPFNNP